MTSPSFHTTSGSASALAPLDTALAYVRERIWDILPLYLIAMAPCTGAAYLLLDAISTEHRSLLPSLCLMLTLATVWRWCWLAALQRKVQEDVRGEPPARLARRLPAILVTRLAANIALTWGGMIVIPAYYGFFLSGLATPLFLEYEGPFVPLIAKAFGWMQHAAGRLVKIALAWAAMGLLMLCGIVAMQVLLTETLLPGLLGLDIGEMAMTLQSGVWFLFLLYAIFLVFDFIWAVAAVMVFYDLQARRLGSDLRLRLRLLRGEETP